MPHDVITQLLRVLAIETKQEKAIINAESTDAALSGLEAFSFDYIVKWPLSLIINRLLPVFFYINLHTFCVCAANFMLKMVSLLLFLLLFQESPDALPDALQTHVLLQTRGEAALQRVDQQQRLQALLHTFSQVVSWA